MAPPIGVLVYWYVGDTFESMELSTTAEHRRGSKILQKSSGVWRASEQARDTRQMFNVSTLNTLCDFFIFSGTHFVFANIESGAFDARAAPS